MARLAKAQLLRALSISALAAIAGAAAWSQSAVPTVETEGGKDPAEFAPGATGAIRAPVAGIVQEAERRGEDLGELLTIQTAQEGVQIEDLEGMRTRALSDPRVRALLGADGEESDRGEERRYEDAKGVLLASFSMPAPSLRQMMQEANAYGMTLVFRGFVNNSVHETRAKLEEVFAQDEVGEAFAIDPTMFRRFGVESVPAVILFAEALPDCETPQCENDVPPLHDRVSGNIPLDAALLIMAGGGGDAADQARGLLNAKR